MYNSVPQNVELSVVPNHYSGRTKFRLALVVVGVLSFFSVAIFVIHRENNDVSNYAFVDNEFYFVHNLFMAAFAFSMVPLADFQVFEYNNPFWNAFKSLSTYSLLTEVESLLQFAYFIIHFDWKELDSEDIDILAVTFNLFILSFVRCIFLSLLFYYGSTFLHLIIKTRYLPSNYYVSSKMSVIEYLIWHSFGFLLATTLELNTLQVCSIVVAYIGVYFYFCEFFFWSKKRHYKTIVN